MPPVTPLPRATRSVATFWQSSRSCRSRVVRSSSPYVRSSRHYETWRGPLWVSRVGLTSCPSRPLYPKQQTFPDPVGTSHLCQEQTFAIATATGSVSDPLRVGRHSLDGPLRDAGQDPPARLGRAWEQGRRRHADQAGGLTGLPIPGPTDV